MNGDFGESFANTLIGQWTPNGQLFETVAIGGKWPTIDIYAEIKSANNQKMFCFFQVKSTEMGYTSRGAKKLKVKASADNLRKLASFNAPTYLIGVEYNKLNPVLSNCYIKTIRGAYPNGLSSMETTNLLTPANLIVLKNEIENFWTTLNPMPSKTAYITNFKMRTIKNYSGWMAEEIAKTYLLETNLFDIYESNEQKFDFLCMSKNDFNKIIAVEVKASKYSQSRIIREYRKIRNEYTSLNIPIIMFYVNYENKTGLIEIINKQLTDKLITLSTENLIKELKNINYA